MQKKDDLEFRTLSLIKKPNKKSKKEKGDKGDGPKRITFTWKDAECEGQYIMGQDGKPIPHGDGQLKKFGPDGQTDMKWHYVGGFKNGKKEGKGRKDNFPDGKQLGTFYEGDYHDDKPHGQGIYDFGGKVTYKGGWRHGVIHGLGVKVNADGTVYDGEWRDGLPHGSGSCTYQDKSVYNG